MVIKAEEVKKLRQKTGAGMMDCKKALVKAEGDSLRAERYLKEMGVIDAANRLDRATNEGRIFTYVGDSRAGILEISCETDFVARNKEFISLGQSMIKRLVDEQLDDNDPSLQQTLTSAIGNIKENMALIRSHVFELEPNQVISHYVHGDSGNIGVLVLLETEANDSASHESIRALGFDIALHVAAFNPQYLSVRHVPQDYISEQRDIFRTQASNLGKPEKIIDNIIEGKIKKHLSEICLLEQPFVKDDKKKVVDILQECSKSCGFVVRVLDYIYFRTGVTQ